MKNGVVVSVAFFCLTICPISVVLAADEICSELSKFEKASPREKNRRWVEFYWYGEWLTPGKDFGFACKHASDPASNRFCAWLSKNTSMEFSNHLPMRLLECKGYKFPRPFPGFMSWRSKIPISLETGQSLVLDIDLDHARAVRLSLFAADADETEELPPLAPYQASETSGPK